ncbi:hypothetical protein [Xylanibacter ruminicola]|uniref:hypothetical protein n=1 Tax=Xylanibacter ruminicola TaxID=839 RepID=UPI00068A8FB7|nr:hypothetical protein [Xylanibacter ruminicola]
MAIVAAALFTSCNKDVEGAIYNGQNNAGVSFTAATLAAVEVPASNPVFEVEIVRGNTAAAATGSVTASLKAGSTVIGGVTVSDFNFAAGENATTVKVNIDPLEVGVQGTLTLALSDADASIGAVKTATIKVSKAYEWVSLGKATFVDAFVGATGNPEVLKADGFERYRVMAPYEEWRVSPEAQADSWTAASSAPFIELWVEDGLVYFDTFFVGLNYDGDKSQPILAHHASDFMDGVSNFKFSKFLDAKTIQLAPYYYIDGLGGWNYTQKNGIITITLP